MTEQETRDKLIELYQQMYELTEPVCAHDCRVPRSCCDLIACETTMQYAAERWNVVLPRTGHPKYPLMGPEGCTALPHLRPMCTMHVCCISAIGHNLKDLEWDDRYWELRQEIDILEIETFTVTYRHTDQPSEPGT